MTYFNTNKLAGDELDRSRARNKSQQDYVLAFFKQNPHGLFSCREVLGMVFHNAVELTSCQRCLTTLTRQGDLEKTDKPIARSKYDKPVHKWCLSLQNDERQLPLF